ncbi:MAG: hypothetical protein ACLU38_14955 [Dysosmobacter sp.]
MNIGRKISPFALGIPAREIMNCTAFRRWRDFALHPGAGSDLLITQE